MKIYAIADLHLSTQNPKPMDIFGDRWNNHWEKIKIDWNIKVAKEDYVLIPGDISWAMNLEEAKADINDISALKGTKIIIKGNHDYWWSTLSKIKKVIPSDIKIIQNDFIETDDFNICGTRGWILPGDSRYDKENEKIYKRELIRLEMSLSSSKDAAPTKPIIVMMHFPPFNEKYETSDFVDIMSKFNVKKCVYGHLHGESYKNTNDIEIKNIEYSLVSCDYLDFKLKRIY